MLWAKTNRRLKSEGTYSSQREIYKTSQTANSKLHLEALTAPGRGFFWLVKKQLDFFFLFHFNFSCTVHSIFGACNCTTSPLFRYRQLGVMFVDYHDMLLLWFHQVQQILPIGKNWNYRKFLTLPVEHYWAWRGKGIFHSILTCRSTVDTFIGKCI